MLCRKVGMSRQNFYKARKQRLHQQVDAELVAALVKEQRAAQPRLGGRKLFHLLKPELNMAEVRVGRDRFFDILRGQGLLLEALPKAPYTTNSRHSLAVFSNLIAALPITAPNQVWVSDITYIRSGDSFVYLSLITDKYSRKIVGHHVADTLGAEGCLQALQMALANKPEGSHPIHHSDRGCQYCSRVYVDTLREHGLGISMTEENHCAENAMAERMNGILKQEYWLGGTFRNKELVPPAVAEAIRLYNTRRPHQALKYKTPQEVHAQAA